jgi:sulfur-carrier protein
VPVVWIPPQLLRHTGGHRQLRVDGATVRQVMANLEARFPALRGCIRTADGQLRPEIAVAVDSEVTPEGLRAPVSEDGEVHFLPALSGG